MLNAVEPDVRRVRPALGRGGRADHRVLRRDRGGRRGRRRAGARHRAVPASRVAQPGRVHALEVVSGRMLLLIPLLPFLGFLVNAAVGRRLPKAVSGGVAVRGDVRRVRRVGRRRSGRCVQMPAGDRVHRPGRCSPGSRRATSQVPFTLRLDPLVDGDDPGRLRASGSSSTSTRPPTCTRSADSEYARYFSYLNLFAAFMLVLVLGAELPGDVRRLGGRRASAPTC